MNITQLKLNKGGRPRTSSGYKVSYGHKVMIECPVCHKHFECYSSRIKHSRIWETTKNKFICCSRKCAALWRRFGQVGNRVLSTYREAFKTAKSYGKVIKQYITFRMLNKLIHSHAEYENIKSHARTISVNLLRCPLCKGKVHLSRDSTGIECNDCGEYTQLDTLQYNFI